MPLTPTGVLGAAQQDAEPSASFEGKVFMPQEGNFGVILRELIVERLRRIEEVTGSDTRELLEELGLANKVSDKQFRLAMGILVKTRQVVRSGDTYRVGK